MTDTNVTPLRKPMTNAERQAKHRGKKAAAKAASAPVVTPATTASVTTAVTQTVTSKETRWERDGAVSFAALAGAIVLTSVEAFFGTSGMVAIYPAAAVPVMVMTAALEAAKLVAAAWLARRWHVAPLLLRSALVMVVIAMMALTAIGSFGFLARAHLDHLAQEHESIDSAASPVAEKIALAESDLRDVDLRIGRLDEIVKAATTRGYTKTAMTLVSEQERGRADLVAQRMAAAQRLADLRVQLATVEARRAQVAAEAGPALYLAQLLGWGDGEAAVKVITLLLVMVIDPAAVLLTLAATYRRGVP